MRKLLLVAIVLASVPAHADPDRPTLYQVADDGTRTELPLVRARAHADVRGPIAEIELTQTFANPTDHPIEAVYVFPLPDQGAVGGMTMTLGDRTIVAKIAKRDDARKAYEDAKAKGKAAALLEQQRPNVFQEAVANILPGEQIAIAMTYDLLLAPTDGTYELALPTVVGPRYQDTDEIDPPVAEPGVDTGNTFDVDLDVDAGVPIGTIDSPTHQILATKVDDHHYQVALSGDAAVANKDFVLRWTVDVKDVALAVLADKEKGDAEGHLALIVEPPPPGVAPTAPRELDFIVDTSGSMDGEPLALAKKGMRYALARLDRNDAFRIFKFSSDVSGFDDGALTGATAENVKRALSWVNGLTADGGTEMIPAIDAALTGTPPGKRTRDVVLMSDGYLGYEDQVLAEVKKLRDPMTHMFSFGVGSSVNRYLIDGLAEQGDGVARYMLLDEEPGPQIEQFFSQVGQAVLTNVQVEWDGVDVADQVRDGTPSLYAGMPIVVTARYAQGGKGTVRIKAKRGADDVSVEIPVLLPDDGGDGAVLGRLWARKRIAELDRARIGSAKPDEEVSAITDIALAHSLMTDYTSFVAIEEHPRTDGNPEKVEVPAEMPEGVTPEAGGVVAGSQGDAYGVSYSGSTDLENSYGAEGECITITDRAPVIDQGSTNQGITLDTSYTNNIPVGRTFGSVLGASATAGADDLRVAFGGEDEPGLDDDDLVKVAAPARARWRAQVDAFALFGPSGAIGGLSASAERRIVGRLALGLAADLWDPTGSAGLAALLATVGRWWIGPGFDLHLGVGPALDLDRDLGIATQLRVGMPLPFLDRLRPDMELRLDAARVGDQRMIGAGLGVGVRF